MPRESPVLTTTWSRECLSSVAEPDVWMKEEKEPLAEWPCRSCWCLKVPPWASPSPRQQPSESRARAASLSFLSACGPFDNTHQRR